MSLSFFYRRGPGVASRMIRGEQMATYLGAKINPLEDYQQDVCVAVKMLPGRLARERGVVLTPDHTYLDLADYWQIVPFLRRHPEWRVIASSVITRDTLARTHRNPFVVIPHAHCNWERISRTRNTVDTVGYLGDRRTIAPFVEDLTAAVASMGLRFVVGPEYTTREEVVAFYQTIDIHLAWRTPMVDYLACLKSPLKLANAGAFGIPSVAQPEPAYVAEFNGRFLPAESLTDILVQINRLRTSPTLYETIGESARALAETYHIDRVAELYRCLR